MPCLSLANDPRDVRNEPLRLLVWRVSDLIGLVRSSEWPGEFLGEPFLENSLNSLGRDLSDTMCHGISMISEYQEHAAECHSMAAKAKGEHRAMLLRMAETWDSLARDREEQVARLARIETITERS